MVEPAPKALYRARQFFASLRPAVSAADRALAASVLGGNSPALALFNRMSLADRQHAIAVLRALLKQGEDHPALQQAALLHDAGKSLGQPVPHRVIIVLLKAFRPALLSRLADAPLDCPRWRRPFVIHALHPEIGAAWAKEAGCDPLAVTLIRNHQRPPVAAAATVAEKLHAALYEADGMN